MLAMWINMNVNVTSENQANGTAIYQPIMYYLVYIKEWTRYTIACTLFASSYMIIYFLEIEYSSPLIFWRFQNAVARIKTITNVGKLTKKFKVSVCDIVLG